MRIPPKLYACGVCTVILSAALFGWSTRQSYQDNTHIHPYVQKARDISISFEEDDSYLKQYFDNHISTLEELQNLSDVIVKVKVLPDRVNQMKAILSKVQVIQVYKGKVLAGDTLLVEEPSSFLPTSYFVTGGWSVMQDDQAYILFLRHLPVPKGYQYRGSESKMYLPVSSYFGKYPVTQTVIGRVLKQSEAANGMLYATVENFDLITTDETIFQTYEQMKTAVLHMN